MAKMTTDQNQIVTGPQEPRQAFGVPRIGRVNWRGLMTLYVKEIHRFYKVITQTIIAPAVTTLLFMAIFMLALGGANRNMSSIPFAVFLAPGLVMMSIIQNAFANTLSSLMIAKVQGNIVDVLMPPLSAGELTLAYAMGGVTRGLIVGLTVALALSPFVDMTIHHPLAVLYFAVSAALLLSLAGILTGIWAEKFDHGAAVTNFIITPLSLLSGTFYSIDKLPGIWYTASHFNPFFYLIDGLRYGFTGFADGPVVMGAVIIGVVNAVLWLCCYVVFKSGYKLRA